jgi:dTDP-4-dehydrorhamnose 3,5-epimerase
MKIEKTTINDLLVITPARHADARGFFSESWQRARLHEHGIHADFVQDNHSFSTAKGTLRGLHYQTPPRAQAKLVRCGRGRIWDVAVDIRPGSPTYGRWHGEELTFENGRQLFVPEGFLHGFVTLEPESEIIYKCTDVYVPECDRAVRFDDPDIAIAWPFAAADMTISDKDCNAPFLKDAGTPFQAGVRP